MKKYVITFFVVFFLFAIAGFVCAHILGKKEARLRDEAIKYGKTVNNVNSPYFGNTIFEFRDKAILYNHITKEIKPILSYQLANSNDYGIPFDNVVNTAGSSITIIGATATLVKYVSKIKVGNPKANAVVWGVVIGGGILGFIPGYYIHDKYFPPCYSNEMWIFLNKKENWEDIYPEIIEKENFITF